MKTIPPAVVMLLSCLVFTSCQSPRPTAQGNSGLRSERQYAEQREARAIDLYKTGQASTMEAARAQAGMEASQQWYAAAKARERQLQQEKFEKDFKKAQAATP